MDRLRFLSRSQWRSHEELLALQLGSLRLLLRHAYDNVPGYRRRFSEVGFDPYDPAALRDVTDLRRLPVLTREEALRTQDDLSCQAPLPDGPMIIKSTSGTTGNPFRFRYNRDSEVWRQAVKLRGYRWAGWEPGVMTVHYWGPPAVAPRGQQALKIALDRALRREVYLDCARQGDADLRQVVAALKRLRPRCLIGFTQATVELGRFILRHGLRDYPAMNVICGAERLFPQDRPILEEAFGRPGSVFETYGCREVMLIASECEAHEGMHVAMENLVTEVVDEAGQPVPPGQSGQLLVTDLHNYGMPLIRYRTGDLAVAAPSPPDDGGRCPCGRGLGRLLRVEGRQADLLRGSDGRGIPGIVFNAIIAGLGGKVDQFQAVQRRDGHIDLKVVPGPEFDESVVQGLTHRLRPYLGDTPLTIQPVDVIPPQSSGKRRHVIIEA